MLVILLWTENAQFKRQKDIGYILKKKNKLQIDINTIKSIKSLQRAHIKSKLFLFITLKRRVLRKIQFFHFIT